MVSGENRLSLAGDNSDKRMSNGGSSDGNADVTLYSSASMSCPR